MCQHSGDCTDPSLPFCSNGMCVTCADACPVSTAPVCDGDSCRACEKHSECASEVCDRVTGACADEGEIIYVDATATGGTTCTQAAPCTTIADGLLQVSGNRNIIKVRPGTYDERVLVNSASTTVTLIGDQATVEPAMTNQSALDVQSANVAAEGFIFTGAGSSGHPGVSCSMGTLRLERSKVIGNSEGVYISNNCHFSLVNNIIEFNGNTSSAFGGVDIDGTVTPSELHEIAFNTITHNMNSQTIPEGAGIACVGVTTPVLFSNNIVYANDLGTGDSQVGGSNCSFQYSDIGPDTVAGTGNISTDPKFVDDTNANFLLRDYHIQSNSPAKDVADPTATLTVDYDEQVRPVNGRADMGADEVTP